MNAIAFRDEYTKIGFTPPQLLGAWTGRVRRFIELYRDAGLDSTYRIMEPRPCPRDYLLLAHDGSYVKYVEEMGKRGVGYLDYGDTPAYPSVYDKARLAVGGTVTLLELLVSGEIKIGFNPQGGFHHARRGSAAGFCVFNDLAIGSLLLRERGVRRVAIVDIDGHHGDGTQQILYSEPILKISIHKYAPYFFPGTGNVDELGDGGGYGYAINIPLPEGSGDDVFQYCLREVVIPVLESYGPQVLLLQMGADGHIGDPLVGLRYTDKSYASFAEAMRRIAVKYCNGRLLGAGGGGYDPDATSRMWALMLAIVAGESPPLEAAEILEDGIEETKSSPGVWKLVVGRVKFLKKALGDIWSLV